MPTTIAEYNEKRPLARNLRAIEQLAWSTPSKLTLWIGAGFAKYYANLPLWAELLQKLADQLPAADAELVRSLISSGRPSIAAEVIAEMMGEAMPVALRALFTPKESDFDSNPLKRLAPATVITTNYDTILDNLYPDYVRLDPRHPIKAIFSSRPKLVKLHGSLEDPSSMVLSTSSYARTYTKEFEWYLLHLFQNTNVLFVGASLSDAEPYIRCIETVQNAGLIRDYHYALVPFKKVGEDAQTNQAIADYANSKESLRIRICPYISDDGHSFFNEFLQHIAFPQSNADVHRFISSMVDELKLPSGESIGPRLFRARELLPAKHSQTAPFINLCFKFLSKVCDGRKYDVVSAWLDELELTLEHLEVNIQIHPSGSERINAIKGFLYDVKRQRRNDGRNGGVGGTGRG